MHSFNSDVGLIKLASPVEFTDFIQPLSLPCSSSQTIDDASDVIAIANGATASKDYKIGLKLQYIQLQTVDMEKCLETGEMSLMLLEPGTNLICAKDVADRSCICNGDMGGPVVKADTGALVGIINGPLDTKCRSRFLQVFTPVSAYIGWIQSSTNINCEKN